MKAQVLFIDDCPHLQTVVDRLREASRVAEADLAIEQRRVTDTDDAQRLSFGGSPSILLDGWDPFPFPQVGALACRLYASPDGGLAGAPSVEQLVVDLRQRLASS